MRVARRFGILGALVLAGGAALSGCVTIAEHDLFVKAAADYQTAVCAIMSDHVFLTGQAEHNWLGTNADFSAAVAKAKK